ncbi:hypothetical protein [Salinivibrio sp. ES.052]|uniref:hypothetical protein n=1 Tax=Salinivibrio sp. ES.052 TaxID=1882823 RepID=UPI00092662C8|nr:hypothetical protein [Salinivibrio sp. ES.052]SIN79811.1 hypothetical protein SAMN05444724_0519 [Salinivibrio sp. ES.052]
MYKQLKEIESSKFLYWLTILFVMSFSLWACSNIIDYRLWGDEAETIVTAKMMVNGKSLYSEIFNHHGPMTFFLGYVIEHFGNASIEVYRSVIYSLQFLILAFIFLDSNKGYNEKLITMLGFSAIIWGWGAEILASVYQYQTLCGLILFGVFYFSLLPSLNGREISNVNLIISCFFLALLPFLAVTYVPISILTVLAISKINKIRYAIIGFTLGIIVSIVFVFLTASFKGYIAYHFYLNAKVLPLYNGGQSFLQLMGNALRYSVGSVEGAFIFIPCLLFLLKINKSSVLRVLFVLAGLCSLLIRAHPISFHGVPYIYATLAVFLTVGAHYLSIFLNKRRRLIPVAVLFFVLFHVHMLYQRPNNPIPHYNQYAEFVRKITNPEDTVLFHSFTNHLYIMADRLPASAHFFYLPWQQKYEENPVLGVSNDICKDIVENRPKAIVLDKWKVWGMYDWEGYAPDCFKNILGEKYKNIIGDLYLRNDISDLVIRPLKHPLKIDSNLNLIGVNNISYSGKSYKVVDDADPNISLVLDDSSSVKENRIALDIMFPNDRKNKVKIYFKNGREPYTEEHSVEINISSGVYIIDLNFFMDIKEDISAIRLDVESGYDSFVLNKVVLL